MNAVYNTIIKSVKITDYLLSKGIRWNNLTSDRFRYKCPLPGHKKDNTPSFFVYNKGDHQDFICYGCKNSGSVIHLMSAYEQISIKEAVKKLSDGLNISIDDVLDSVVKDIINSIHSSEDKNKTESIIASSLFISVHMHDFLKKVDFDPAEMEIAEKVFALVDGLVLIENLDEIEQISLFLPEKTKIRYNLYIKRKKQEEIQSIKNKEIYDK
jgi:hypothetical protein